MANRIGYGLSLRRLVLSIFCCRPTTTSRRNEAHAFNAGVIRAVLCLEVPSEMPRSTRGKRAARHCTVVRPLAGMLAHVRSQVAALRSRVVTAGPLANERLLPRVRAHMPRQMPTARRLVVAPFPRAAEDSHCRTLFEHCTRHQRGRRLLSGTSWLACCCSF